MKKVIFLFAALLVSACSPNNSPVEGRRELSQPAKPEIPTFAQIPADSKDWVSLDGGQSQLQFSPKVDIIFVEDNSGSMQSAQNNLVNSINRFAESFQKNKVIDYHIGVVSVWDSSEKFLQFPNRVYGNGELHFAKDSNGKTTTSRFVSRESGTTASLAATLKIGISFPSQGGPEFEEMFSPVLAAIEKTGHGDKNEGFFRSDAQLVVVFLTDADDSTSNANPDEVAQALIKFKGGNSSMVSAYGALVKSSDSDESKDPDLRILPQYHKECFDFSKSTPKNNGRCKGFGPERLEQFIVAANSDEGTPTQIKDSHIMSLIQKDFGNDLAKIGSQISAKTLSKVILLNQRPRVDEKNQVMIRVHYGKQEIPQGPKGWMYDPDQNVIRLGGNIIYEYQPEARFSVDLVPVLIADKI